MRRLKAEVIIVGGGLAGLSAAIYLGRAKRDTLLVDTGQSMARWEPDVENYLGFPHGIAGVELLQRGLRQACQYGLRTRRDRIISARKERSEFVLKSARREYGCRRLLLATGIFHLPPEIPSVAECLGQSLFFCKDCDGFRVRGKAIGIYGRRNEAVEYALGMLPYSRRVVLLTDGEEPAWSPLHRHWVEEYRLPVVTETIVSVRHRRGLLQALELRGGSELNLDALFTTRGDLYSNELARGLRARLDAEGQVITDIDMRTTVKGVYAAGCVTPANCQMVIAAGQGATAAQAINRDLFEESLATHSLRRFRRRQLRKTGKRVSARILTPKKRKHAETK